MKLSTAFAATLLAVSPSMANATTVAFTYNGVDQDNSFVTAAGSGTIAFDGTGNLSASSLSSFSFNQTTTLSDPSLQGSGSFSYGLADLLSFSGVFNDGSFSSLSLLTRTVDDASGFLAPESFRVRSLRINGATTAFDDRGSDTATTGTVQLAAAVPEPGTWAIMTLGIGLTGFALRRRKVQSSVSYAI